ncbi:uncharacterized protein LOC111371211 [Olea europaea var. sylvestris]|uniref:uncharacterized protein LOC111371211 n=1 Tax=Olea europaea var. sylvestris TaxID=158386 RepID=UPI000C1CCF58|nr:uncharacterized protein LOC111371211 [Olea europaea var. sylvestris]
MFVLIAEKLDFLLEEKCPEEPTETTSKSKRAAYDKWIAADKMKLESQETSYDILESLKGMFGHQSRRARFEAIHTLQNIRMKPGTPVKDHMLTMIAHFNVTENLSATINQETQVDMVLNSLSDMFSQFTEYVIN